MESAENEIIGRQLALEKREQELVARESQNSAFVSFLVLDFSVFCTCLDGESGKHSRRYNNSNREQDERNDRSISGPSNTGIVLLFYCIT